MKAVARFLTWDQVQEKAATDAGTILVEHPTLGCNVTRAWWTKDDVLAIAPAPPPRPDGDMQEIVDGHPFDIWCHDKYTHPIHGCALLFAVWSGEKPAKRLVKEFPTLRTVAVWSGWAETVDWVDQSSDEGGTTPTPKKD